MPRPKIGDKRGAILAAATRVILTQGLSAPTMGIAKEAGVANGSLFTYFETKEDLLNQLYLELKTEMASAAMKALPKNAELRELDFFFYSCPSRQTFMNMTTQPDTRRYSAATRKTPN